LTVTYPDENEKLTTELFSVQTDSVNNAGGVTVEASTSGRDAPRYDDTNRFHFSSERFAKLTHYAFRYPAKFHVPVVRALLDRYTLRGWTCLDAFNGSGTLTVEAMASGRNAIGLDVDPLAVFVSRVKTTRVCPNRLEKYTGLICNAVELRLSRDKRLKRTLQKDIGKAAFKKRLLEEDLQIPPIPNLEHWFRKSVVIQLARIKALIVEMDVDCEIRDFFLLCWASIIRSCSNADPTPVSGLEVTSYMRRKEEEGREIDVERHFIRAVRRGLTGAKDFYNATSPMTTATCAMQDARALAGTRYAADAVITSPPYHSAVDYYRRHQLETYWLDLVRSQEERLSLIPTYLGRAGVAQKYLPTPIEAMGSVGSSWIERIDAINERRARDFLHYYWGMRQFFCGVATLLPSDAPLVLVVGNNRILGREYSSSDLFDELAQPFFSFDEQHWYPVRNRYMSYSRHNGANIDREDVLVWRRRGGSTL